MKAGKIGVYCFISCDLESLYLDSYPSYDQYSYQLISTDTLIISSNISRLILGVYVAPKGQASSRYENLLSKSPSKILFEDCNDDLQIGWIADSRGNDFRDTYYRNSPATFQWGSDYDWGGAFGGPDTEEVYLGRPIKGCEMETNCIEYLTLGVQLNKFSLGSEVNSLSQLPSLKNLTSLNSNPPLIGTPTDSQYKNVNVVVPQEFISGYMNDTIWSGFWDSSKVDNIIHYTSSMIIESIHDITGKLVKSDYNGVKIIRYKNGVIKKTAGNP